MTAGLPKGAIRAIRTSSEYTGEVRFHFGDGTGGDQGGSKMIATLLRLLRSDDGQGMVEYALIIALVAVVLVVALTTLSTGIGNVFASITSHL